MHTQGKDAGKIKGPAPKQPTPAGAVTKKAEVMDDFLRNFFVKMGLSRTCETFEAEWYELKATGRLEGNTQVPDVYQRNMVGVQRTCCVALERERRLIKFTAVSRGAHR